ncbi:FtsB family cell division protein [Zhaonella formicivorans]|uniref:FtsB family cell division protein n=1 Tax=Zhaonella formicivorans TaxID=2528593 RepID=UPI0010E7D640|nr:septum formation initiator family protein [Zhaonella formicivorans]
MLSHLPKVYDALELGYREYVPKPGRKTTIKRRVRFKGRALLFGAVIFYVLLLFGYWHYKINQVEAEIQALEAQKNAILAEQARLKEQKKLVMSKEYVERAARENLGLVKPGETVLLFAEPGKVRPLKLKDKSEIYD